MQENKKLPTISELRSESLSFEKQDELNFLVNQLPKKEWIKINKYAGNSNYIPIAIIETLIQKIFGEHKIEVIETKTMFNAVSVTVRIHYKNPITNEWLYHDGVGAVELQTKAGSGCLKPDFSNINTGAVMMALPMAKSYALKDGISHIGKLFGRDLNRKDVIEYQLNQKTELEDLKELYELKKENLTPDEQINAERIIKCKEENSYTKLFKQLKAR